MEKEIFTRGTKLNYEIRKSKKARNLRLAVYPDGKVVATLPCGARELLIEEFVLRKSEWILRKLNEINSSKNPRERLLSKFGKKEYNKHKKRSLFFVKKRLEYLNGFYNLDFNRVSVRNQRTRWGSCSRKGNLNFNYRLVFLPEKVADYVIVHELCHIKEFNHSASFWELVAKTFPDYKNIVRELKNF